MTKEILGLERRIAELEVENEDLRSIIGYLFSILTIDQIVELVRKFYFSFARGEKV